jgi:cell division protein FtsZ
MKKKEEKTKEEIKKIKIRVIGIGGGGGNIVAELSQLVKGASFFAVDTDLKALKNLSGNLEKFQFGQNLTKGLGTGMDPKIAKESAQKEKEKIKKILEGQDLIIFVSTLGGGVGSGASPIFAHLAQNLAILTYGIFTLPFSFEGEKKLAIAKEAVKKLKRKLNAITILPNERIFQIIEKNTPLKKALSAINQNLAFSLQSLIEIIYKAGLINIDFADLKTIFEGIGSLTYLNTTKIEKDKEKEEIEKAINSPLFPYNIEGAKSVLFNIAGPKDLSLFQVSQISKTIFEKVDKEAKIIFGISQNLKDSQIKLTLLAGGCRLLGLNFEPQNKKLKIKPPPQKLNVKKRKVGKKKIPIVEKKPTNLKVEKVIRKDALSLKKEIEKEESEILEKEKTWEVPTFLRKKLKQYD